MTSLVPLVQGPDLSASATALAPEFAEFLCPAGEIFDQRAFEQALTDSRAMDVKAARKALVEHLAGQLKSGRKAIGQPTSGFTLAKQALRPCSATLLRSRG